MSIFSALRDAIFGQQAAPPPLPPRNGSDAGRLSRAGQETGGVAPPPQAAQTPADRPTVPMGQATTASIGPAANAPGAPPSARPQPMDTVDIETSLNRLAAQRDERLNWRTSIVDLLKLVGMDSSLDARRALADELGYGGDKSDSAAMNVWLHRHVMRKLAENGGRVPNDLPH